MKTANKTSVKSELDYYKEIREFSPKDLRLTGKLVKLVMFITNEFFMFFTILIVWSAILLVPVYLTISDMSLFGIICGVFAIVFPIVYQYKTRPEIKSLHEEMKNMRNAYKSVIEETKMS